jgi:ubiquinone/menaquinone biosynthesis C-methylase UbiE
MKKTGIEKKSKGDVHIYYPESKVEITGFFASHYDKIMDIITFGRYSHIMRRTIQLMGIKPDDRILDLGAGTGENACLMRKYISSRGEILGLDISEEMISQFTKRCANFPNIRIINARIDQNLVFKNSFDKVFISFVLHGFPQKARNMIIRNAYKALKEGGEFFILDYNEFSLSKIPFYQRIYFKMIECPYAFDFIERDWKKILWLEGFNNFWQYLVFGNYLRLLKGVKVSRKS